MAGAHRPTVETARRWWVMALVCTAMYMGVLDSTSVYRGNLAQRR